jgi:YHS domain-containing protein
MLIRPSLIFASLAMLCLAGCASDMTASAPKAGHAECLVCKMNVDLACIDVKVGEKTPQYLYMEKTYFFCSEDCKNDFIKNPSRYAPAK